MMAFASIASCTHPRMRRINETNLLRLLHLRGPMSRVEMAREMGLDGKTLTNLTRDLLKRRLVVPHGMVSRRGRGRPRENLRLRAEGLWAIGLHVEEYRVTSALINMEGKIRSRHVNAFRGGASHGAVLDAVRTAAQKAMEEAPRGILGLGLAFPGMLDQDQQVIVECVHLRGWENTRMEDLFHGVFPGRVHLRNFTETKALAEQWFGEARQLEDFLLMDLGVGIGCVQMIEGRIRGGTKHMAGEIGHMIFRPEGVACWCGRRGCLETVASLDAVRQAVHRVTGRPLSGLDAATLARLAGEGNRAVGDAIREAAGAVGLVLANLVDILGPSHVILSGESMLLGTEFIRVIEESVRKYALPTLQRSLVLAPTKLGEDAALLGSAVAVLQSVFDA